MYKRILVPIDGSEAGHCGLREAIALATDQKATLHLLHVTSDYPVIDDIARIAAFEKKYHDSLHQYGRDLLDDAKALAASACIEVETVLLNLRTGRVADAIVEEAKKAGCELIVLGTHGRRGISRAVLGSDAEKVVQQSPVPVLLVRGKAAAE